MLKYILCALLFMPLFICNGAIAQDLVAEEIAIQETPKTQYNRLLDSISFPLSFENHAQFEIIANKLSYSTEELQHKLFLLARLSMNHRIKNPNKSKDAELLIQQLSAIAVTPYDMGAVAMLTGRFVGRVEHNYEKAISHYNQALGQIQDAHELKSLLLRHTIHRHLGMLYILTRQKTPALKHFTTYRELAYQLRDNYLIATAEGELGKFYNKTNQLSLALQHYSEAFRLANQTNYPKQKAHLQLRLARIYRDLEQWDQALMHAQQAIEGFKLLGSEAYISNAMTVIAMVHAEQEQWNQAIDYYLNAQQIDKKIGNVTAQGLNYHNLGEAHSKIGDIEGSLKYLLQANKIFTDRNIKHYLVSNELLIAQVAQTTQNWPLVELHASLALDIAIEKALVEEQIQAMKLKANALKALNKNTEAIQLLEQVIDLSDNQVKPIAQKEGYSASLLAEQKLKLEVNIIKNKLADALNHEASKSALLAAALLVTIMLALTTYYHMSRRREQDQDLEKKQQLLLNDPASELPGYRAFLARLDADHNTKTIALFSVEQLLHADITLGQFSSNAKHEDIVNTLETKLEARCYIMRPGVFALAFKNTVKPEALTTKIATILTKASLNNRLALGLINLPIFANPSIRVGASMRLEALQLALNGAMSLNYGPSAQDRHFVSLRTLDFAPSAIFSRPLSVHLEQAIQRGLIRVNTNGDKANIVWNSSYATNTSNIKTP